MFYIGEILLLLLMYFYKKLQKLYIISSYTVTNFLTSFNVKHNLICFIDLFFNYILFDIYNSLFKNYI